MSRLRERSKLPVLTFNPMRKACLLLLLCSGFFAQSQEVVAIKNLSPLDPHFGTGPYHGNYSMDLTTDFYGVNLNHSFNQSLASALYLHLGSSFYMGSRGIKYWDNYRWGTGSFGFDFGLGYSFSELLNANWAIDLSVLYQLDFINHELNTVSGATVDYHNLRTNEMGLSLFASRNFEEVSPYFGTYIGFIAVAESNLRTPLNLGFSGDPDYLIGPAFGDAAIYLSATVGLRWEMTPQIIFTPYIMSSLVLTESFLSNTTGNVELSQLILGLKINLNWIRRPE